MEETSSQPFASLGKAPASDETVSVTTVKVRSRSWKLVMAIGLACVLIGTAVVIFATMLSQQGDVYQVKQATEEEYVGEFAHAETASNISWAVTNTPRKVDNHWEIRIFVNDKPIDIDLNLATNVLVIDGHDASLTKEETAALWKFQGVVTDDVAVYENPRGNQADWNKMTVQRFCEWLSLSPPGRPIGKYTFDLSLGGERPAIDAKQTADVVEEIKDKFKAAMKQRKEASEATGHNRRLLESCTASGWSGNCQDTATCTGVSTSGLCSGASNIQCCTHPTCTANGIPGTCEDESTCSGITTSGLCPGASNYKCCTEVPCVAGSLDGVCKNTADCDGVSTSGLCAGPSQVQCCTDAAPLCTANGVAGSCLHTSQCSGGVSTPGQCPGSESIQCCTVPAPCTVAGVDGLCKDTATCGGTSTSGHCPGASNIQCCTFPEETEDEIVYVAAHNYGLYDPYQTSIAEAGESTCISGSYGSYLTSHFDLDNGQKWAWKRQVGASESVIGSNGDNEDGGTSTLSGGGNCVGRCGAGCNNAMWYNGNYFKDCFDHDSCLDYVKISGVDPNPDWHAGDDNCGDEWLHAADDYAIGLLPWPLNTCP